MAAIRRFQALRPPGDKAASVSAVPYDVVDVERGRSLAGGNPLSFLHISRAEIDLPDGTDPYSDLVYAMAARRFEWLKRECPLILEDNPSLYAYRLRMGSHEQTGLVACCSIAEYDSGIIRKHELTRKDKEDDRTRHILELHAQTGPVFLTYRGVEQIDKTIAYTLTPEPLCDFTAPDGVQHTIWRALDDAAAALVESFRSVPLLYIADGHHRAASASRAAAHLRSQSARHTGEEEYDYFLAVLFPSSQVQILPYNRSVKHLNGLSPDDFLKALSRDFTAVPTDRESPVRKGNISMYLAGQWYGLEPLPHSVHDSDPITSLDVSILQRRVLDPLLGIKDERTDKRIEFVGGILGPDMLRQLVDGGKAAVAFSMFPVTIDDLMRVADAGQIMPPKSTWFEPKLRDGLLTHVI
jgi:uncharacterized protein (DUF1015 family)